ncbi:aspartate/glutamate racemase family protein [Poseidonocella sp. HB161398]|uniref:aspartate/glutamate racemase family protein n=1 Tax=Poseidonocella sp. HB161398 TaxID=2320855 RepID=UPI001108F1FF|nr:amino acid racemase [Poseidonocella sp. HB161398]
MTSSNKARPLPQKVIGILGGMSSQATAEYYRMLNARMTARLGGWDTAEIVTVSVNFGNIEHFVRNALWAEAEAYLAGKLDRLERAGADVILCASNTMHRVVAPAMEGRATPFLHIADPAGDALRRAGLSRAGLLGTLPVMQSGALRRRYRERFGIEILVPPGDGQQEVDRIIFDELVHGALNPGSKAAYLRIAAALQARGAQALILGCTEICLLIGQDDLPGLPVFDTTSLHVDAALAFALG